MQFNKRRMTVEFHEKLKELRSSRGLTQAELAEVLFVSRTAVSKWESGRGYPNIDSLLALSAFFSVPVDELIRTENVLLLAERDKKETIRAYASALCCAADMFVLTLLFLPVFGASAVPLLRVTGFAPWEKATLIALVAITALNGACGLIVLRFDKPTWLRHRLVTGIALSVTGAMAFILAREVYAAILVFALLLMKGFALFKANKT